MNYPRVAQFKTVEQFRQRLAELGLTIPCDDHPLSAEAGSPLATPWELGPLRAGNRWCIHPMEGWDAQPDGNPSELTLRRWRHFGLSGAKLLWGGEAAAVTPAGRANPRQTMATPANRRGLAALLQAARAAHREQFGGDDDLLIGLQLTHSGRFARPHSSRLEPRLAWHHPLLDARFGIAADDASAVMSDGEVEQLQDAFVAAARLAREVGFQFVDIKACHGYLLHEFLGAHERPGPYGGDLAGRSRLLTNIVARVRQEIPALAIGVRLSAWDSVPYERPRGATGSADATGRPTPHDHCLPYRYGFGLCPESPCEADLSEAVQLAQRLAELGVSLLNVTGGSPYYNPHMQRPAIFPPSDGYQPPEDPLVGVARHLAMTRQLKRAVPQLAVVGSGYSYLQEYLPHVAQAVVRAGDADFVGIGRMVLSYPELPADVLAGRTLARKKICRTFSDCTTAPRSGLVSGCYPLDAHYKQMPEAAELKAIKAERA